MTESKDTNIRENMVLPVLPLRNMVLLPGTIVSASVGREKSLAMIEDLNSGDEVVVAVQRAAEIEDPTLGDLYPMATLARVHKVIKQPDGFAIALHGLERFAIDELVELEPYWTARGKVVDTVEDHEASAYADALRDALDEMIAESGGALEYTMPDDDGPSLLADRIAATLGLEVEDRMKVLETLDATERLRLVTRLINDVRTQNEVKQTIQSEVRRELTKNQREHLLRQQLRAIQNELGEGTEDQSDALKERLVAIEFPEDVQRIVDRELGRLETLQSGQAEYNVVRTYLEWIADLPWDKSAPERGDIEAISDQLDADHYGLGDVKERILEHMAVLQLSGNPRGTILCLAGPPGVGKTSLGRSIADATGRPFVRIALGGVRDEAEIRGHRRTYVGSRPGRLIHALRKAGANNPVVLLDEVDKLGRGYAGDPEAALLEVLDPEQNHTFQDHYLEVPFDLSKVLFIVTANQLENMSAPLRDRMEIIEVSGYTLDEKLQIARNHLLPKQLKEHAIAPETLTVTDDALRAIIGGYTREAGVRQLQRHVTKLCRSVALEVVRGKSDKVNIVVDRAQVEHYLGQQRFFNEVASRTSVPGVATGMAWTPVGGDILFVETSKMPGSGLLKITGQLGDVMQESAHAAMTYIRSHAAELGIDVADLKAHDVHIHVPAGAVPKDGPSAGVTMFTALTSLFTDRRVRADTSMTGECTLSGRVLPVGGIKAKVLAAHRAGIRRVILPMRNLRDLTEVPDEVKAELEVIGVDDMSQALHAALESDEIGVPSSAPLDAWTPMHV